MELEIDINKDEICRACLDRNKKDELKNIFSTDIVNGDIVFFSDIFEAATNSKVEKNDGLPTKICLNCKVQISEVFCFLKKCTKSLELLRKIFKVPEKIIESKPETVVLVNTVIPEKKLKEKVEPKIVIIKDEEFEIADVVEQDKDDEQIEELMIQDEDEEEQEEEIYLDEEFIIENEKSNDHELSPEKYKCTICNAEFVKSNDIKLHLKEAHSEDIDIFEISGDEMYLEYNEDMDAEEVESDSFTIDELNESNMFCCSKCNIQFDSVKSLHDHQQHLHSKQTKNKTKRTQIKKHFCELCLTNICGLDRINVHIEMHKKTLPTLLETIYYFQCGKCSQIFLQQSDLFDHTDCIEDVFSYESTDENFIESYLTDIENCQNKIFTCEKHEDDNYKCSLCDIIFEKKFNSVSKHFVEDHSNTDLDVIDISNACKLYQCSICKTTFKNSKEAMAHMYILHLKSFSCPIDGCGNEYNMFSKLSVHIQRLHLNEQHICKHCMGIFQSPQELSTHLRENCDRRVLTCNMCEKKFLTDLSLKLHLRMHNKEKRFACTFCDKKFVQRGDLTTHERIHTGDRPFKCHICNNRFRTSGHKKDHMSTHVSDKNFECTICFKKFKAERILKGHMKAHENGKPFSCPECDKKFSRKHHVKTHLQTHIKDRRSKNPFDGIYDEDENEEGKLTTTHIDEAEFIH